MRKSCCAKTKIYVRCMAALIVALLVVLTVWIVLWGMNRMRYNRAIRLMDGEPIPYDSVFYSFLIASSALIFTARLAG
jgi:hypothetical protein